MEYLSYQQISDMLGVDTQTIKKARRIGKLKAYKFGHRLIKFKRSDVEQFIESCKEK